VVFKNQLDGNKILNPPMQGLKLNSKRNWCVKICKHLIELEMSRNINNLRNGVWINNLYNKRYIASLTTISSQTWSWQWTNGKNSAVTDSIQFITHGPPLWSRKSKSNHPPQLHRQWFSEPKGKVQMWNNVNHQGTFYDRTSKIWQRIFMVAP
jgi:hypothetical protein